MIDCKREGNMTGFRTLTCYQIRCTIGATNCGIDYIKRTISDQDRWADFTQNQTVSFCRLPFSVKATQSFICLLENCKSSLTLFHSIANLIHSGADFSSLPLLSTWGERLPSAACSLLLCRSAFTEDGQKCSQNHAFKYVESPHLHLLLME